MNTLENPLIESTLELFPYHNYFINKIVIIVMIFYFLSHPAFPFSMLSVCRRPFSNNLCCESIFLRTESLQETTQLLLILYAQVD